MSIRNSHCSYCGSQFVIGAPWPRQCPNCNNISYINPLPVVVVMLTVWDGPKLGTLIQQRNINPKAGEWALTGGYIDMGETWQDAACREVREELGLEIEAEHLRLMDVKPSTLRDNILIFCRYNLVIDSDSIRFTPNEEVRAIKVISEPMELCFPTHTEAVQEYFSIKG